MKILVTGGAGYIGSSTVRKLIEKGHAVVVYDNLVYGHEKSISCQLIKGDLLDKDFLFSSLEGNTFDAVIHFAAYAYAGESMLNPFKYFHNNIMGGLNLLEYMKEKKIKTIIFSSSCSIYGYPEILPVTEETEKHPESVYGQTKLMFEDILSWYDRTQGIKYINLRYFNAAGALRDGSSGEDHDPETHLIPLAIQAVKDNQPFTIFGSDYQTADGTCIRDYIYIEDLALGHILALDFLQQNLQSDSFNLGSGIGYSNKEVISMLEKVSNKKANIIYASRRPGDPPAIYADITKARNVLKFTPKHSDLKTIIRTAWEWHNRVPHS